MRGKGVSQYGCHVSLIMSHDLVYRCARGSEGILISIIEPGIKEYIIETTDPQEIIVIQKKNIVQCCYYNSKK